MKKITDCLIYGLFFCIFIMGCTKEPLIPPVEPPITIEDPVIKSLIATPATIFKDSTSVLSWEALNAVSFSLILQNGDTMKNLSTKGSYKTSPLNKNATFVGIAYGKGSPKSKFVIVNVKDNIPPLPLAFAVVYDSVVKHKSNTTVSWTSSNAISVLLNGISVGFSGSKQFVSLTKDTILHFRCYGSSDSIIKDVHIKVEAPIPLTDAQKLEKTPWRKISCFYDTTNLYRYLIVDPIQDCAKDDSLKFRVDQIFEEYQGVIKCDPSWPQLFGNGAWSLSYVGGQTILYTNYAPSTVIQLDSTILKIQYPIECTGLSYPYRYYTDTYTNVWPVGNK